MPVPLASIAADASDMVSTRKGSSEIQDKGFGGASIEWAGPVITRAESALPRGVFCAGSYSNASTWAFNVVRQIYMLRTTSDSIVSFFSDEFTVLDEAAVNTLPYFVVKTHQPSPTLRSLSTLAHIPVLLTVRDPRDTVASLMMRFKMPYEEALSWIDRSCERLEPLLLRPDILLLRYEDGFADNTGSVTAIARWLGATLTEAESAGIFDSLTPAAVKCIISELRERGSFMEGSSASTWDVATQWHPGHVGDGRVGKWQDVITASQAARIARAARKFCAHLGYRGSEPLFSGNEIRFASDGTGAAYLESGFSDVEEWGVWTDKPLALLRLPLCSPIKTALRLSFVLTLAGVTIQSNLPDCRARLFVNEHLAIELQASAELPDVALVAIVIEHETLLGKDEVQIRFEFEGVLSLVDRGLGQDARALGVGLKKLRVDYY